MITISVVSHSQSALVEELLKDLARLDMSMIAEVLITLNIPEEILFEPDDFPYPVSVLKYCAPGIWCKS